jgi:hypothetical protein
MATVNDVEGLAVATPPAAATVDTGSRRTCRAGPHYLPARPLAQAATTTLEHTPRAPPIATRGLLLLASMGDRGTRGSQERVRLTVDAV